jgi:negative regulator of sigma-B (phosphoserine phosphatase)
VPEPVDHAGQRALRGRKEDREIARALLALVFGGVLGYRMPNVRAATMPLERGDVLVMITDGIDAAISPALAGGGTAQTMADRIFAMHGKGTDDALAVVVRYR